jgi:3-isopropylmalate/(R)-2-methylmalate dehydratase large subunit
MAIVLDHGVPTPNAAYANVQKRLRTFSSEHEVRLFEQGDGISHVVACESGLVAPGSIVIASDSHTTTNGAMNALATGMGATDMAVALGTGELWFKVPHAIRVELVGALPDGCSARDIALHLLENHGTGFVRYQAVEFAGPGLASLSMDARFTLCNKGIELGAKFAVMPFDEITAAYCGARGVPVDRAVTADPGALYLRTVTVDLGSLAPLVAQPHNPSNVVRVDAAGRVRIDLGFIGTCTNGRLEDLRAAARQLRGKRLAEGRRLIVVPASREVYAAALAEGLIEEFVRAGAIISASGCGPCAGVQGGIPGDAEAIVTTAPRNFRGRMGNPNAELYLASPATVAASVVEGYLVEPREASSEEATS